MMIELNSICSIDIYSRLDGRLEELLSCLLKGAQGDKGLVSYADPECNTKWVWHISCHSSDQQNNYVYQRDLLLNVKTYKTLMINTDSV